MIVLLFKQYAIFAAFNTVKNFSDMCDALRDLVLFVQFKKREKH